MYLCGLTWVIRHALASCISHFKWVLAVCVSLKVETQSFIEMSAFNSALRIPSLNVDVLKHFIFVFVIFFDIAFLNDITPPCVLLHIFLSLPATMTGGERAFSHSHTTIPDSLNGRYTHCDNAHRKNVINNHQETHSQSMKWNRTCQFCWTLESDMFLMWLVSGGEVAALSRIQLEKWCAGAERSVGTCYRTGRQQGS